MAVNSGKGITPNPALALSGLLDEIRGSSVELPQGVFLQRASELIPVLDGGALRKKVESYSENLLDSVESKRYLPELIGSFVNPRGFSSNSL